MPRPGSISLTALAAVMTAVGHVPAAAQELEIPETLAAEHQELHAAMKSAAEAGGEVGEAARKAMATLEPHFAKEEAFALPQLGVLPALAGPPFAAEAQPLDAQLTAELATRTERLRAELPAMLEEHETIAAALEEMRQAAERAGQPEQGQLAAKVVAHARSEETILYPAALLVGRHIGQPQD